MKNFIVSCLVWFALFPSAYADSFYGEVVSAPKTIKVRTENGKIKTYQTPGISTRASIDADSPDSAGKGFNLGWGRMTTCMTPYLGQLAETISVTIKMDDGSLKTAIISRATAKPEGDNYAPGNARVYGTCGGSADQLVELSIATTLTNGKLQ